MFRYFSSLAFNVQCAHRRAHLRARIVLLALMKQLCRACADYVSRIAFRSNLGSSQGTTRRSEDRDVVEIVRGMIFHESQLPRHLRRLAVFGGFRRRDNSHATRAFITRCCSSLNPFQRIIRDARTTNRTYSRARPRAFVNKFQGNELKASETLEREREIRARRITERRNLLTG